MFANLASLSLVTLLLAATPLLAQEPHTDDPEPGPAQKLLDMGQPVNAGPELGERYSKAKHGDWDLTCINTEAEVDPCSLEQILRDDEGFAVAVMSLFRLKEGGQAVAGATMLVPLETLLTARVTISIDGGPGKQYNYSFCSSEGCIAQIGLTQADVDAYKRGNMATITIVPARSPDEVISLPMSLTGFTAGYKVVDVVANR